jgi:folate-dependent phosphoribosylglycinamide formyltransferase PurN
VPVVVGDSERSLHERIKAVERRLYPSAIREFLAQLDAPALEDSALGGSGVEGSALEVGR